MFVCYRETPINKSLMQPRKTGLLSKERILPGLYIGLTIGCKLNAVDQYKQFGPVEIVT